MVRIDSFNDRGYPGTLELKRPQGAKFSTTPAHSHLLAVMYVVPQGAREGKSLHYIGGCFVDIPGVCCSAGQPNEIAETGRSYR